MAGCGCAPTPSCCDGGTAVATDQHIRLGYNRDEINALPEGAEMSLGCGNPTAIASLKPGETVLDLGSGGGLDCFIAAKKVGESGRVIGVDMTPEMVARARENASKGGFTNVEFRLGEIEHLPVADGTVDVIISNCVINLAPDKRPVYKDAFRALKPGGRLAISDVVATGPVPEDIRKDALLWAQCAAGAMNVKDLETLLDEVGFKNIRITPKESSREMIRKWGVDPRLECFVSADIQAVKP
jgi:ubiquinone/menaquinone biosynthesis C-methylase UbiE